MRRDIALLSFVMLAAGVTAQTVTGSGTSGTVPVFNGTSSITNSPITVSGSNVGIGMTSPSTLLDVKGNLTARTTLGSAIVQTGVSGNAGGFLEILTDGGTGKTHIGSYSGDNTYFNVGYGGNVGIGTASPGAKLDFGNSFARNLSFYDDGANALSFEARAGKYEFTIRGGVPIYFGTKSYASPYSTVPTYLMMIDPGGNVGIGTTSPNAKLEVNGNLKLTSGSGGSVTFADGTQQTTAWTGVLCGGDYAEAVKASGPQESNQPGDVLVLAANTNGNVEKSREPYSTLVAGVVATKPGVIGRRESLAKTGEELPMAMVGIVPTKVSAENGPIHQGDLLVTSSTIGFAMKGTDRTRMLGAVIGKAMGKLESGTGTIEVLVTLQ